MAWESLCECVIVIKEYIKCVNVLTPKWIAFDYFTNLFVVLGFCFIQFH